MQKDQTPRERFVEDAIRELAALEETIINQLATVQDGIARLVRLCELNDRLDADRQEHLADLLEETLGLEKEVAQNLSHCKVLLAEAGRRRATQKC
jgi:hypothetical protein